jgi:hypothetical protein
MITVKQIFRIVAGLCAAVCLSVPAYAAECGDCPDAYTTATQNNLYGETRSYPAGEGVMSNDAIKEEIAKILGGSKQFQLYVLGTSYNNKPLTTTAEWAFDNETLTLYGMHEKNTEKLIQIDCNQDVSINWHEGHFESFSNFRGIQMEGTTELIDGTSPDFDSILINYIPYEAYQDMLGGMPLDAVRSLLAQMMIITKITIDEATITNTDFKADGYRTYQRWIRGISLKSFTAAAGNKTVKLAWATTAESDNSTGFNIYRSVDDGEFKKINSSIIASVGPSGGSYTHTDSTVTNRKTYTYMLTSVDKKGAETKCSLVSATPRWLSR